MRKSLSVGVAAVFLGGLLLLADKPKAFKEQVNRTPAKLVAAGRQEAPPAFYQIPQNFEPLQGTSSKSQSFVSHGPGYSVLLDGAGAHFVLRPGQRPKPGEIRRSQRVDMHVEGAHPVTGEAMDRLEGVSNYLLGNNPSAWRTRVPHFGKVRFRDVYAGVDLIYYGNQMQLEYDFVVKPGGNPEAIRLAWAGVEDLRIDSNGDLLLTIAGGVLRQLRPRIYQDLGGRKVEIAGGYRISTKKEVTFALGRFDRTKPLVIDPVMAYASYIGGAGADESFAIAVDDQGSAYIGGRTESGDFRRQVASPAFQTDIRTRANQTDTAQYDAFVVKINPAGTGIVFSTYLGGSDHDSIHGIAVDGSRNVYVVGETKSIGNGGFPTAGVGARTASAGGVDGFITKLDSAGASLIYSTYLGTPNQDVANSIVLSGGSAFVTGQWNYSATGDIFVARYGTASNATQEAIRTIGGTGNEYGSDIAADSLGNLYVTGRVTSAGLQTGASALSGLYDGFLARLSPALLLTNFTYFGGADFDEGSGVTVSSSGEAYITGTTYSTGLGDNLYGKNGTGGDAYVARFNASGALTSFGYFGGTELDSGSSISIDTRGTIYVAGLSQSSDFPVSPFAEQRRNGGQSDSFVIRVTPPSGSNAWSLLFSTYFGGAATEVASDLALSSAGVFVTGTATAGPGQTSLFPSSSTNQILRPAFGGGSTDSFVARLANAPVTFTTSTTYGPPSAGRAPVTRDASNFRILRSTTANNTGTVLANSCGANLAAGGTGIGGVSGCPNCQGVPSMGQITTVTATTTAIGGGQICSDQPAKIGCETNNEDRTTNDGLFRCPAVNPLSCAPTFLPQTLQLDSAAQERDVTLEIPADCSWNVAAEQNSFVQVLSPLTGSDDTLARGRGTVRIRVSQNGTGQTRTSRVAASSVLAGELIIQQSSGLAQGVSVSITPTQATLTAGQSTIFTSSITGAPNAELNYSLSPADGTIVCSGTRCTYTAPAVVAFTRTVTLTARSVQDPNRSAAANITLQAAPAASGLRFVSMDPCRLMETRAEYNFQGRTGAFGPPYLRAGETRTLTLANSNVCQVPAGAKAYVLNVTLVPRGGVDFVTIWPGGEARPEFWSIRSPDGQTVANSAIVKAGNGVIQVYSSNDSDILLDISGYMTDDVAVSNLAYYPLTPCRVIDTRIEYRQPPGPFGPPSMSARETRRFRIPATPYCSVPAGAAAYSVTITAVPQGPLQYLTAWPDGRPQPNVSNINSPNGRVLANSVIVPASGDGTIDVFAFDRSDFLVDINGYFATDNGAGLLYYPVSQCRAADSRAADGTFGGPAYDFPSTRTIPLPVSSCAGIPSNAKAYAMNVTAIPGGSPLPYLTAWPTGGNRPNASILNAFQGQTVTNTVILPTGTIGAVDIFAAARTHVVVDVSGYFASSTTQAGSIINGKEVDGLRYCLDVPNGDYRHEVTLITWPCHGGDNQQFTRNSAGEIKIAGYCVDAYAGGSNGASVGLWSCHGGPNQKWTPTPDGRLLGEGGFCMAPRNGLPGYATDVILVDCQTGAATQKWVVPKE